MTVDQPMFALAKEIRWVKSEDKLLVMIGDLHVEIALMKCLGVISFVMFENLGLQSSWYQHFKCP